MHINNVRYDAGNAGHKAANIVSNEKNNKYIHMDMGTVILRVRACLRVRAQNYRLHVCVCIYLIYAPFPTF